MTGPIIDHGARGVSVWSGKVMHPSVGKPVIPCQTGAGGTRVVKMAWKSNRASHVWPSGFRTLAPLGVRSVAEPEPADRTATGGMDIQVLNREVPSNEALQLLDQSLLTSSYAGRRRGFSKLLWGGNQGNIYYIYRVPGVLLEPDWERCYGVIPSSTGPSTGYANVVVT